MRRREFITLIGGAAATWPLAARAQSSGIPVIGVLNATTAGGVWVPLEAAFRQGLSDTGYAEGRNVRIEGRWAEGQYDRLPALATELTQHGVAVIVAFTTPAAQAAKAATATIPIVFTTISNPVQIGLVASLNRPGGNLTGVTVLAVEVGPKSLELLHSAVPSAKSMALLINPRNPNADAQSKNLQTAAQRLGLQLHVLNAITPSDFDAVFAKVHELKANALMIAQDVMFNTQTAKLAELALRYAIPAIYPTRDLGARRVARKAGWRQAHAAGSYSSARLAGVAAAGRRGRLDVRTGAPGAHADNGDSRQRLTARMARFPQQFPTFGQCRILALRKSPAR
jgi:putative tryptophan/tyrosine transport system substrate-binding protein